jgi:hypothetical protein
VQDHLAAQDRAAAVTEGGGGKGVMAVADWAAASRRWIGGHERVKPKGRYDGSGAEATAPAPPAVARARARTAAARVTVVLKAKSRNNATRKG